MIVSKGEKGTNQTDVLQLACDPIESVRIGFIGLGKRGKEAFNNFLYIDGVEIVAICDMVDENIAIVNNTLNRHNKKIAEVYSGDECWRSVCEREDVNLVYVCTDRSLHVQIAVYAMKMGKHVAVEVPIANTLEECWQLVDTAEKTRKHCMMLENCCYGAFEMTMLNMAQQGLFGEIFHVEGGYIHNLRELDFEKRPHYLDVWSMKGNPYPTHALGPICQLLNIHRSDKLESLVSVSSGQFEFPKCNDIKIDKKCILGNMNTTIIRTQRNKTIVLQHDISSSRPYSRNYLLSGTKGFAQKRETPLIALSPNSNEFLLQEEMDELLRKYEHPFYVQLGELAREVGTHGGMNFIMDYRLIFCLQNGLPLDMDVYDAVEWSSIIELSAQSVNNGSVPVDIPDFTRGGWKTNKTI